MKGCLCDPSDWEGTEASGNHPAYHPESIRANTLQLMSREARQPGSPAIPKIAQRVRFARYWRGLLVQHRQLLAERAPSDTAIVRRELLPLLAAIQWQERNARRLLAPTRPGGRPVWLPGVRADSFLEPVGRVVVVARSESALLPLGIDLLQAAIAGNRVAVDLSPRHAELQTLLVELARSAWDAACPGPAWIETLGPNADELFALRARPLPDAVVGHADRRSTASIQAWAHSEQVPAFIQEPVESVGIVTRTADVRAAAHSVVAAMTRGLIGDWVRPRRVFVDVEAVSAFERAIRPHAASVQVMPLPHQTADDAYALARVALGHHARSASGVAEAPTEHGFRPLIMLDSPPDLELPIEPVPVVPISVYADNHTLAEWVRQEARPVNWSLFGSWEDLGTSVRLDGSVSIGHWASRLTHPGLQERHGDRRVIRVSSRSENGGLGLVGPTDRVRWIDRLYRAPTGGASPDLELRPGRTGDLTTRGQGLGLGLGRRGKRQRQA